MSNKIKYVSKPEVVSMADDWFKIATHEHFWMKWRFSFLKKILAKYNLSDISVFEVGCGSGTVMVQFRKDLNKIIDGADLNEYALKMIELDKSNLFCYNIFDRDPSLINRYECILLLDVIEHIDDDIEFLKVIGDHLVSGNKVIINVPAYQHLFSRYDEAAGHKRRYSIKSLEKTLIAAGYKPLEIRYWGMLLYPIAFIRKLYLRSVKKEDIIKNGFKVPNKLANFILTSLMLVEKIIPFKLPFGTSVMAIAHKKD